VGRSNEVYFELLNSCSVKDKLKSGEIVVTGDRWPIFLYANSEYDPDDPWNGLLRNNILVNVRIFYRCAIKYLTLDHIQAFKYVFTSPSSVDKEPKATRSGNARLHNMTRTTAGSIAYIATQVLTVLTDTIFIF
jgi:hypothetical protein